MKKEDESFKMVQNESFQSITEQVQIPRRSTTDTKWPLIVAVSATVDL